MRGRPRGVRPSALDGICVVMNGRGCYQVELETYRSPRSHGSLRTRMLRLVYNVLICLAAPVALLSNLWRGVRDRSYRERLGERFGFTQVRAQRSIWIHAVSVGEVQAAASL